MKRPPGFRSASKGTFRLILSKSSIVNRTPASRATASRCSTAFVEPPVVATAAMALSRALRVMIRRGRRPFCSSSITSWPQRNATSSLRRFGAGQRRDRVEQVPGRDQLDGVCDHFAADKGGLHAFRAHGDALGGRNGVVLGGGSARLANAGLHFFGETPEMVVAGHDLDPGVGHSYERAGQVVIGEPDGLEHGASRRSARPVYKVTASAFRLARPG